jgi:phosphate transport system permease protein
MNYGLRTLTAAFVLALMISPLITSLSVEIFKLVPVNQKLGFLSLGTTYWETIKFIYLKPNLGGLVAECSLGLSRALGVTMAVAMVIGNFPSLSWSVLAPSATISIVIANEYAEATDPVHLNALVGLALVLFSITFLINLIAKLVVRLSMKYEKYKKQIFYNLTHSHVFYFCCSIIQHYL